MAKEKKLTFEEGLERIEAIVEKLDEGKATLEESLALFEEGSKLVGACSAQLKEYEQKVTRLSKAQDGSPVQQPFEEGEA